MFKLFNDYMLKMYIQRPISEVYLIFHKIKHHKDINIFIVKLKIVKSYEYSLVIKLKLNFISFNLCNL